MKLEQSKNQNGGKTPRELKVVEEFLRRKICPKEIAKDKGQKRKF